MSDFTEVWNGGPDGEVICPCGRQFYYDAHTEDNLVLVDSPQGPGYKVLVLHCPSCHLQDEAK